MTSEATTRVLAALAPERGRFLAFARARIGPDAEDVLQVALLRAALKAQTLKDPARVVPWFFQILRHAIADHRVDRVHAYESSSEIEAAAPDPPRDVCGCPSTILGSLRPEYAEILHRVDVDDQPLAESAAALGITTNNAAVRLHRARKALRDAIFRICGTDTLRACLDCSCDA